MGKEKGDWLINGMASSQAMGWVTVDRVNEVMPGIRARVTEWRDRQTAISFGSGWEGDVEGYEKEVELTRVIRNDISKQYKGTLELEGWTVPQIMINFMSGNSKGWLVDKARQEAGIPHAMHSS